MDRFRVVIVGSGIAGVQCARTLRRRLSRDVCEVVLFNRENHVLFHSLLAEVAGNSIDPDAVAAPLRQFLRHVSCRTENVTEVDLRSRSVAFEQYDGQTGHLDFDHVVVACGREVNLGAVPGMADHSFPFRTVGDALELRAHAIRRLEHAETCGNPAQRRWLLHFLVVGGGFSGVEVAGELNDLVRGSRRSYPDIDEDEIRVTLVHSGEQILPEIAPSLRDFARREMERAGITMALGARAAAATGEGVWLKDGRVLRAGTIVSTIGAQAPLLITRMETPIEGGALVTEPDMRLPGHERAWAIGDCARITNAANGRPCPPTGPFAERQGRQVAENIVRVASGQAARPFAFEPHGQMCAIGRRRAVAEISGRRLSGLPAWLVWRTVHLSKLPTWPRRVKVALDWAWELLFERDLVTLRCDPTERVSHASFHRGEYVFRQGEPALDFYAVEKGEVEVVRAVVKGGPEQLVAVLGPGEFFGEMALLEHRARSTSVRARTDVEVTTLGAQVFSRLSKSLAPLQQQLADTLRRRTTNAAARLPEAHTVLEQQPLASLVESGARTLSADSPIQEALRIFAVEHADVLYLTDGDGRLNGVLTRTDLLRAVDAAMASSIEDRERFTVRRFMTPDPVAVTIEDSPTRIVALLWGRGLKVLPVVERISRRLIGCVRAETVMHTVLTRLREQLAHESASPTPHGSAGG